MTRPFERIGPGSPPTARQEAILAFIRRFHRRRGYGPSFRDIAAEFGIGSPNGVQTHIRALRRKGLLGRDPGDSHNTRARTLVPVDPATGEPDWGDGADPAAGVPLKRCGRKAQSWALGVFAAIEDLEDHCEIRTTGEDA